MEELQQKIQLLGKQLKLKKANIVVIGEKRILEEANKLTGLKNKFKIHRQSR